MLDVIDTLPGLIENGWAKLSRCAGDPVTDDFVRVCLTPEGCVAAGYEVMGQDLEGYSDLTENETRAWLRRQRQRKNRVFS